MQQRGAEEQPGHDGSSLIGEPTDVSEQTGPLCWESSFRYAVRSNGDLANGSRHVIVTIQVLEYIRFPSISHVHPIAQLARGRYIPRQGQKAASPQRSDFCRVTQQSVSWGLDSIPNTVLPREQGNFWQSTSGRVPDLFSCESAECVKQTEVRPLGGKRMEYLCIVGV